MNIMIGNMIENEMKKGNIGDKTMEKPNEKQKHQIKAWLDDYNNQERQCVCPFEWQCQICRRLFPEVSKQDCPCEVLSIKEVVKRAKEWI